MIIGSTTIGSTRSEGRPSSKPANPSRALFGKFQAARGAANREAVLAAMPGSISRLAERTGLAVPTVFLHITAMLPLNQVHISSWLVCTGGGAPAAIYSKGEGVSAPRPTPSRKAMRVKAWRLRQSDPNRKPKETHGQ